MIRTLMASSAIVALVTAGALSVAQAQTEQPADATQPAVIEQPAAGADAGAGAQEPAVEETVVSDQPTLTPNEPTIATAFIGQSVFSSEDPQSDNIGEVNDLIIGQDGRISHAVVGVGGFLGIGEKDVAVPFEELRVVDQEGEIRLIYAATRDQLEAAEQFDRTAYDPQERNQEQQQAEADSAAGAAATGAADATADAADATADAADATADAAGAAAGAATGAAATAGAMATGDASSDITAGTATPDQQAATTTQTAEVTTVPADTPPAEATTAPADTQTAVTTAPATGTEQQMAAGNASPQSATEGFMSFSADQVRASAIMGQEIYGQDNEAIGEVSDLVLQDDGKTRAALIDVGGFLGIGEKRVAIPFDQIQMTQPAPADVTAQADPAAQTDPNAPVDPNAQGQAAQTGVTAPVDPAAPAATAVAAAEPRLTVAMTREQLEQLPEYEDPQEQAAGTGQDVAATEAATTADPNAPVDPNAPAAADPNAPADQQMAAATAQDQYQPVTNELSADNLMGSSVIGSNEENLGEVGDVVFDPSGAIQAVVVDIGGFLGIGEKSVAIQYDSLNVQKNNAGDVRLLVNATQEQLENAPEYDVDAATGQNGQAQPQPAVQ